MSGINEITLPNVPSEFVSRLFLPCLFPYLRIDKYIITKCLSNNENKTYRIVSFGLALVSLTGKIMFIIKSIKKVIIEIGD